MSDDDSEPVDGENQTRKFKDAFLKDYSNQENFFCYTKIVYKHIFNVVLSEFEKNSFEDLMEIVFNDDGIPEYFKWDELLKFHLEKLPLVYSYEDSSHPRDLSNFHDLMFGSSFRRGSKYYGTNFLVYSSFLNFVPPHEDCTNNHEYFFEGWGDNEYYLSRRFDGWAAVWNGKNLYSRNGKEVFVTIPKPMFEILNSKFQNEILIGTVAVVNPDVDGGNSQQTKRKFTKRNIPAAFANYSGVEGPEICKRLCFLIYDIISVQHRSLPYEERYKIIKSKIGDDTEDASLLCVQVIQQTPVFGGDEDDVKETLFQEFISNRKGLVLTPKDATYLEMWGKNKRKKIGVKPKLAAQITGVSEELPDRQGAFTEVNFDAVIDEKWQVTTSDGDTKTQSFQEFFHVRRESRRITDFAQFLKKPIVISPGDFKNDVEFGMDTRYLGVFIDPFFPISLAITDEADGQMDLFSCNVPDDFHNFFRPEFIGHKIAELKTRIPSLSDIENLEPQGDCFSLINFYLHQAGYNFNFNEFELLCDSDYNFDDVELHYSELGESTPLKKQNTILTRYNGDPIQSISYDNFWISQFYRNSNSANFAGGNDYHSEDNDGDGGVGSFDGDDSDGGLASQGSQSNGGQSEQISKEISDFFTEIQTATENAENAFEQAEKYAVEANAELEKAEKAKNQKEIEGYANRAEIKKKFAEGEENKAKDAAQRAQEAYDQLLTRNPSQELKTKANDLKKKAFDFFTGATSAKQRAEDAAKKTEYIRLPEDYNEDTTLKAHEESGRNFVVMKSDFRFISNFSRKMDQLKTFTKGSNIDKKNLTIVYFKPFQIITDDGLDDIADGNNTFSVSDRQWYTIFEKDGEKPSKVSTKMFDAVVFEQKNIVEFSLKNVLSDNRQIKTYLESTKLDFKVFVNSFNLRKMSVSRAEKLEDMKKKYSTLISKFAQNCLKKESLAAVADKLVENEKSNENQNVPTAEYLSFFLKIAQSEPSAASAFASVSSEDDAKLYLYFFMIFLIFYKNGFFDKFIETNFEIRVDQRETREASRIRDDTWLRYPRLST